MVSRFFPVAAAVVLILSAGSAPAASNLPANLDNGLRVLLENRQAKQQNLAANVSATAPSVAAVMRRAVQDEQGRVMVNIRLDGKTPLATLRDQVATAGGKVAAESAVYRKGILSAFLPVDSIATAAQFPGVLSASLGKRPIRNIGAATSGGVFVIHSDTLNGQGIIGTGATVGVLSDSFDGATLDLDGNPLTIHAAQDIASGDLPGPGNPDGYTTPVQVIEEYNQSDATDEGRAMLQIIHDVAPGAHLAFATAFVSEVDFANNIRNLRTAGNCDVICDDVFYTSEPFFSDGIIAQAVDDVVTSGSLPGKKCSYFSAAGNQQGGGFAQNWSRVADATARAGLPNHNIKLSQVPGNLTAGGFHNFAQTTPADIAQRSRFRRATPGALLFNGTIRSMCRVA